MLEESKKLAGLHGLYLICEGNDENLTGIVGGENLLNQVLAPPLVDDDKILAPMVVAAIANGARVKSLCDALLELEGHDGVGAY